MTELNIEDNTATDPHLISETFNEHFSRIGISEAVPFTSIAPETFVKQSDSQFQFTTIAPQVI